MLRLVREGNVAVQRHLLAVPPERVWLSSVAAEEAVAGRLANIQRARSGKGPVTLAQAHGDLTNTLMDLCHFRILPFSEAAESVFGSLPARAKRVGSQDCRIAAQAVAAGVIVVTRNLRDFEDIGVACTDWSS